MSSPRVRMERWAAQATHDLICRGRTGAGVRRLPSRAGFTLIELLVVVSIIALLISILLPSLRAAREQAKRTVCASHVHQQVLALMLYAQDNAGNFALNATQLGGSGGHYVDTVVSNSFSPDTGKPTYDLRELFRKYVSQDFEIFACPSNGGPKFGDPAVQEHVNAGNWLGGQYQNFYNSTCVFKYTSSERPWAPKPEWTGWKPAPGQVLGQGVIRATGPPMIPVIQDAFWASGSGTNIYTSPDVVYYFNHAKTLARAEFGAVYGRFYAFRRSRDRSICGGANVGYLDGHSDWAKNVPLGRFWQLDLPWSGSAMRPNGTLESSGVPLTLKLEARKP